MVNICVTGIQHQGLIQAVCLAELDNDVNIIGWRKDYIYEPNLEELIDKNICNNRLHFYRTINLSLGLQNVKFVYICNDITMDENNDLDFRPVYELAESIGHLLDHNIILCVTAQVPIGTSNQLATIIRDLTGYRIPVVYIPEFLRMGKAIETFMHPDRIVIGCNNTDTREIIQSLYLPLKSRIIFTDICTAEMSKQVSNAFLATSIGFINEIADLCEVTDTNINDIAEILKADKRIGGYAYLNPGKGFSNEHLGRDLKALQMYGKHIPILEAVWNENVIRK